jgi:acetyltransferase-like isoleucine patch superfamily enzyme
MNVGKYYIGYAVNQDIRYQSSSGGIGTILTYYLLSLPEYGTGITFYFDEKECMYLPQLIYSTNEINITGSLYQDINIFDFIKKNIDKIKDGIVLTCPPCQVLSIRKLLDKNRIKNFILSFSCSGQVTIEGTWNFYRFIGINKLDVINMRYRGNGWPSGIQIWTRDGKEFKFNNYSEPWKSIHQSFVFQPKRCFYCKRDASEDADVSLADPWLEYYLNTDRIGSTMFKANSYIGVRILEELYKNKKIEYVESSYDEYSIAQKSNILKKRNVQSYVGYNKVLISFISNKYYNKWVKKSLNHIGIHNKIFSIIKKLFRIKRFYVSLIYKFNERILHLRAILIAKKLGECKKGFIIYKNVKINNSKCVYLGSNVGIEANTFLNPITEYEDIVYNPKIIIGDATWIGKYCKLSAIHKIQIGKNVLIADCVHIADHFNGYEDVLRPISSQRLISKGPVVIDDNCWLGFNCEILSGVHIGKHSIVASKAVVTKDVPPYSVVAGNPAKIVKQYNQETKKWEEIKK